MTLPGSGHPRIGRNIGCAPRLRAVNVLSASEAHRAAVCQFGLLDAFPVDKGAVAALQVEKRVCVLHGHQFGVTFGDGRVLDDEGIIERAADRDFRFVEDVCDALYTESRDRDEMRTGVEVFFRW